jgi:hypothetical protein
VARVFGTLNPSQSVPRGRLAAGMGGTAGGLCCGRSATSRIWSRAVLVRVGVAVRPDGGQGRFFTYSARCREPGLFTNQESDGRIFFWQKRFSL